MEVSVVIPTYFRPDCLTALLNSILKQTVKPIEAIIVDDTPTAAVRNLVEDYEIPFNRVEVGLSYAKNPRGRSTSIARNVGAKMAKGDILLFLDSDVILHADYVQKLLEVFEKYPEALGVAGWIVPSLGITGVRYYFFETLRKLFFLFRDSRDTCRFPEYPIALTKITRCYWFSGSNMAWKYEVFNELEFDENLMGYAFMEDVLFSSSIHKKHPGKLLMTPYARCTHTASKEGRLEKSKLRYVKLRNRKYVLTRLFGVRGLLMFGRQNLGLLVIKLIGRIRKKSTITDQFL